MSRGSKDKKDGTDQESERRKNDFREVLAEKVDPQLIDLNTKITGIEANIGNLKSEMSDVKCGHSMRLIEKDLHDRKWSLILYGVKGAASEKITDTHTIVQKLGVDVFGTNDVLLKACHRLAQTANANIYVEFVQLHIRDTWLYNAKKLKAYNSDHNSQVSLSPDLPPTLRPVKANLMEKRKNLPERERKSAQMKFYRQWPFFELKVNGKSIRSDYTKDNICNWLIHPEDKPKK